MGEQAMVRQFGPGDVGLERRVGEAAHAGLGAAGPSMGGQT